MEKLLELWNNYKGAIIGILIAIVLLITRIYNMILASIILIITCCIAGNYVQKNKDEVKYIIKKIVDKM